MPTRTVLDGARLVQLGVHQYCCESKHQTKETSHDGFVEVRVGMILDIRIGA